jgi:hypothetical protein
MNLWVSYKLGFSDCLNNYQLLNALVIDFISDTNFQCTKLKILALKSDTEVYFKGLLVLKLPFIVSLAICVHITHE